MTNPAIAFSTYFLEMIIAYMFFSRISARKHSVSVSLGLGSLIFGIGAAINLLFKNDLLVNSFLMLTMHVLFVSLCFFLKLQSNVFYTVILSALCAALEVAPILLMSVLTGGCPVDHENNMLLFAFDFTISKSLYLISCLLLSNAISKISKSSASGNYPISTLLYPTVILTNLVVFHYICMNEPISIKGQYLLGVISIVVFVATVVLVFVSIYQAEQHEEYLRISSELARVKQEISYYDILDKQNQQLMIYAHDAKNHMAAIRGLSDDSKIRDYVDKLSGELDRYTQSCRSGNKLLDVILNRYVLECKKRGLHFEYDVKVCNLMGIEDIDLVAILGNLLDNALEAAEKSQAKNVYLETSLRNAYQVIVIQNSSLPPKESYGHLQTSKSDRSVHGFGLKSVAKCLKKYRGDLHWDYDKDENIFTMTVMIDTILQEKTVAI